MRAGHPAWAGQDAKTRSEIAASLPEACGMKIQPLQTNQGTQIDVYCSPNPIPDRKSLDWLVPEAPNRITDVLKIESHSALQQARPHSAPVSKAMPIRPLTGLMAVGTAEGFLW